MEPVSGAVPHYDDDLEGSFSGPAAYSGIPEEMSHEFSVSGHTQLEEDASDD